MAVNLTKSTFDSTVGSDTPVLIDFWAAWCGPCRMLTPTMEELNEEYAGKAVIAKVNVDEEPELAQRYGVMSIPTVFLMKNGQIVDSSIGVRPKSYYTKVLDAAL
ncbi:MAG: thioredoxin [Eubacteriales bacterium]